MYIQFEMHDALVNELSSIQLEVSLAVRNARKSLFCISFSTLEALVICAADMQQIHACTKECTVI